MLPKVEQILEDLKNERNKALQSKHDYQAIGLRKAIDALQDLLIEEKARDA